jgi:chloride channel 3/4/5
MDLVYECFVKLGLRYICVLRDGRYAGMVSSLFPFPLCSFWVGVDGFANHYGQTHKKTFVKYMRELEEKEGHM